MQMFSLAWGVLALIGMAVAFLPCFGSLNWLLIPFAVIGLVLSIIAFATAPPGQRGAASGGIICCVVAVAIGLFRLTLGGGVL